MQHGDRENTGDAGQKSVLGTQTFVTKDHRLGTVERIRGHPEAVLRARRMG